MMHGLELLNCSSLTVFIVTFVLTLFLCKQLFNRKLQPPCLPWLPFIGSRPFMTDMQSIREFYMKKWTHLGPVFAFYAGSQYTVIINGRQCIEEALLKRSTDFAGRETLFTEKHYFNPKLKGIVHNQHSAEFRRLRILFISILKQFGLGQQRIMEKRIIAEVECLIEDLKETRSQPVNPEQMLAMCSLRVMANILFGRHYERGDGQLQDLMTTMRAMLYSLTPELDTCPLLRFLPYYRHKIQTFTAHNQRLVEFVEKSIDESLNGLTDDCFPVCYVRAKDESYDREELVHCMRDLLGAGIDTLAATMLWSLLLITNSPTVQDKLHQELDSVVPRDRLPTVDDHTHLPYLQATILEVMRCKTLLPFGLTHSTVCDTQVGGYFIPAKTRVIINIDSVHMNSSDWSDPTAFKPERFLDENSHIVNKNCLIPFSLGRRACIGQVLARQELFLLLASVLHQFTILPPAGKSYVDYSEKVAVSLQPSSYQIRFVPRFS